jgi:hypothetical protein
MITTTRGWLTLALALALSPTTHAMTLREVLVFHVPALKADADTKAFEQYVLQELMPAWKAKAPDMPLHLVRADRGNRKGQYVLVWTIGAPAPGTTSAAAGSRSAKLAALMGDFEPGIGRFVDGRGTFTEYQLLSPQTAGSLPQVNVLGMHFVKVKPARRDSFESFVRDTVHPAVANLRPDLRVLYYRSTPGDASNYVALFALTVQSRDKYWPGGSDSDDLRAAFEPVQPLTKELATYLVEGSFLADPKFAAAVYESREWADFVEVAPGTR